LRRIPCGRAPINSETNLRPVIARAKVYNWAESKAQEILAEGVGSCFNSVGNICNKCR